MLILPANMLCSFALIYCDQNFFLFGFLLVISYFTVSRSKLVVVKVTVVVIKVHVSSLGNFLVLVFHVFGASLRHLYSFVSPVFSLILLMHFFTFVHP